MTSRWCTACGDAFIVRSQVPEQTYCGNASCQRERRRLWQQAKRISDPDYLINQAHAQSAWGKRNPDYWKRYREDHPEYTAKNRSLQKARNAKPKLAAVAKMDGSKVAPELDCGMYRLKILRRLKVAKEDAWVVQIQPIFTSES